jgi:hypothetical protein
VIQKQICPNSDKDATQQRNEGVVPINSPASIRAVRRQCMVVEDDEIRADDYKNPGKYFHRATRTR